MSIHSIPCDLYVDISGADSALPFSRLNDALDVMQPGQTLMAVSNKTALQTDMPEFCQQHNLALLEQGEVDEELYFLISVPAAK